MERHAQSLVSLVTALAAEHVGLQVLLDGEETAACGVRSRVDTIGAEGAFDNSRYVDK